jgi:hypothetical protein
MDEEHLLAAIRYVSLNSVPARPVERAEGPEAAQAFRGIRRYRIVGLPDTGTQV